MPYLVLGAAQLAVGAAGNFCSAGARRRRCARGCGGATRHRGHRVVVLCNRSPQRRQAGQSASDAARIRRACAGRSLRRLGLHRWNTRPLQSPRSSLQRRRSLPRATTRSCSGAASPCVRSSRSPAARRVSRWWSLSITPHRRTPATNGSAWPAAGHRRLDPRSRRISFWCAKCAMHWERERSSRTRIPGRRSRLSQPRPSRAKPRRRSVRTRRGAASLPWPSSRNFSVTPQLTPACAGSHRAPSHLDPARADHGGNSGAHYLSRGAFAALACRRGRTSGLDRGVPKRGALKRMAPAGRLDRSLRKGLAW